LRKKILLVSAFFCLTLSASWAFWSPEFGALSPPGYTWDSAHCFLGKPTGNVKSFIYQGGFYHSGSKCQLGAVYDAANCYLGAIPCEWSNLASSLVSSQQ
jgi:hypothetical protein